MRYKKCPNCGTEIGRAQFRTDGGYECKKCGKHVVQNKLEFEDNEE